MDEDPSEEELREASLLLGSGRRSDDAAEDYSGKVNEVLGSGAYQRAACVTCGLGVAAGSTEVMAIGLAIPMIEAEFGAGDWERNLVASCIFLGMLLGGLISGVLGDLYGRKTCMTFFTAVIAVFGGLTAIAGSLWQVACFRFLAGLGIGGNIPAIFSYVAETTHSRGRGQYMTFVASHWMLGSVVTAAIGWIILPHDVAIPLIGLSGWRAYFLVCIAPAVLLCALASLVLVESPCFLIRRRKFGAAAAALETIATANGEGGSPALAALVRQLNRHELDHEAGAAGGEGEGEALALGLRTTFALIRDFLRQRETRKLTIVLGTVWFCLSACWYGFMIWIPQFLQSKHDDVYLGNLVTSAGDLPGNVISFLIIERQGRKRTLLCSLAAASLSPIAFAAAPKGSALWAMLGSACFGFVSVGAWNALSILSPECFETRIRGTMHGVLTALGRVGGFAGTFVVGHFAVSSEARVWVPCLFASSVLAIGWTATLFLPETAGKVLTEYRGKGSRTQA